MEFLNVNSDAVIGLTAKLERLNKSAFPSAVRNTLNRAAFDMRKSGMLNSARKNFNVIRDKNLFTKLVIVDKAKGWDVNNLTALVGFANLQDKSHRTAIEGLRKHENGGAIDDGFRYLKEARISGNLNKKVKRENYYDKSKVISGRSGRKGNRRSKFVVRAYRSKKENKPFFLNSMKGNFLVKTKSFKKNKKTGKVNFKLKFLMMDRSKSPVKIRRNNFVSEAAKFQSSKMSRYYKEAAKFQFNKILR